MASHNLPFHYVRHTELSELMALAVPGYSLPASETLTKILTQKCESLATTVLSEPLPIRIPHFSSKLSWLEKWLLED
jgi:hypothetical protein